MDNVFPLQFSQGFDYLMGEVEKNFGRQRAVLGVKFTQISVNILHEDPRLVGRFMMF